MPRRSLTFTYAPNNIDLLTVHGPGNELLSSNAYNSAHQVLTNYNAAGDMTTYQYASGGVPLIFKIKTPLGLTIRHQYYFGGDHDWWLEKIFQDELGTVESFGYYKGAISAHTNVLGLVTTYERDNLDRVVEWDAGDMSMLATFEDLDLTSVSNALNETNRLCYDEMGRICEFIDPLDNTNRVEYCDCGLVESVTDPLDRTTVFDYDLNGNRTSVVFPDGQSSQFWKYDLFGQVTNVVVTGIASVTNYYNNQGLICVSSNALGLVASYQYDHFDRPTNVTDANGVTISMTYDLLGRMLTRSYPDGGSESWGYSAAGVVAYTNQLGKVTRYGYDLLGRITAVTNANSEVTRQVYDLAGNVVQLIDGKNQTNTFAYDQHGRLTNQVNAAGTVVLTNSYDAAGQLATRWTPAKGKTTYSYDGAGNLSSINYPTSTDLSFTYNGASQPSSMTDAAGTTVFTYTANGELESEDGPWASDAVSYAYTNRLRKSMSIQRPNAPAWLVTYEYDSVSRLASIASPAGSFGYAYQGVSATDGRGSLIKKLTHPNGSYVTNTFNSMGQLLSTTLKSSWNGALNSHGYVVNLGGQRTKQTRTAGDYVNYTYDDIGQLKSALAREPDTSNRLNEQLSYGYDAAGNLAFRTNAIGFQSFTVNNRNELVSASRGGTYSPVLGNTTATASAVTVNGNAATLQADNVFVKYVTLADGLNTLTAIATDGLGRTATNSVSVTLPATVSFTYDANGNMTSDGLRTFVYDDENQLISVYVANSWKTDSIYDGMNRRRVRRDYVWRNGAWATTAETLYIYDGSLNVQERNGDNIPLVTYTRGIDLSGGISDAGGIGGLLARTDHTTLPNSHAYYHQDGNGNVTALVIGSQQIGAKYTYDPYGNVLARSGPLAEANRMQFSGKETDRESGLSYYGRRFYEPKLQRWINEDPAGTIDGPNLFGFVGNRPVGAFDPWGLDFLFTGSESVARRYSEHIRYADSSAMLALASVRQVAGGMSGVNQGEHGLDWAYVYRAPDDYISYTTSLGDPIEESNPEDIPRAGDLIGPGAWPEVKVGAPSVITSIVLGVTPTPGGSITRRIASRLWKALPKGGTYMLKSPETRKVLRTGRTNDLRRREGEHGRHPETRDLDFEIDRRTDNPAARRGREERLYERYPDAPLNKRRPISLKNPQRERYLREGDKL